MWHTWIWSLPLLLLGCAYAYARYKQTYWSRRGVYSPACDDWLFGHFRDVLLFRSSASHVLAELYHRSPRHVPVLGVYALQKPLLLIREPELMRRILVKDFRCFPNRHFAEKRKRDVVGSASLFAIDNPPWKYLRTKLNPAFSNVKLKKLFELMIQSADNMREHLAKRLADRQIGSVEVRAVCNKYTTDVISSLTFGIKTNSFELPVPEFYMRSRKIFDTNIVRTFELFANYFFPKINDLLGKSFLGKETDYLRRVFWNSMNEREKSGTKRNDIIDLLLDLKNEKPNSEFKFEGDYLLSQSAILFVAGLETSAITMCFALFALSGHPEVQERVRQEIREKIQTGKSLAYEHLAHMVYLNQVISETLRLYPPAPIIDRVAVEDYQIPGTDIIVEKGRAVYIALKGIHEDPEYHPDPLKFDPDRFSEERKKDIKPGTYMPFGDGPRICIGMRTALLQAMVGLITILSEYEVSLDPNHKNEVNKRAMFTSPLDGIHLYLKKNPIFN